jgi:hypothetical protein
MKTSEGKIIHLEINRTETLQKCFTDKKKKTPNPTKGSNFVSPKNTKHPEPSTGPKKESPKNHVIKKCNQETMGSKHAIKNRANKTCNQKPCQQKMQSKTVPSK